MAMTTSRTRISLMVCAAGLALGGAAVAQDEQALIDDALAAAPPSLQQNATVKDWEGNVLREGTSGYTCYPTPPQLEGTAPMCLDGPWSAWAEAWMNKGEVNIDQIGVAYMLAGDEGASNVDPYAEGSTDDNEWVVEGPHLMIVVPDAAVLETLPTDPENGGPYVMWKGTPYAHIMVPVAE